MKLFGRFVSGLWFLLSKTILRVINKSYYFRLEIPREYKVIDVTMSSFLSAMLSSGLLKHYTIKTISDDALFLVLNDCTDQMAIDLAKEYSFGVCVISSIIMDQELDPRSFSKISMNLVPLAKRQNRVSRLFEHTKLRCLTNPNTAQRLMIKRGLDLEDDEDGVS